MSSAPQEEKVPVTQPPTPPQDTFTTDPSQTPIHVTGWGALGEVRDVCVCGGGGVVRLCMCVILRKIVCFLGGVQTVHANVLNEGTRSQRGAA